MPDKSPNGYLHEKSNIYSMFKTWKKDNNATVTTEPVLLAYFNKLAVNNSPVTLWTYYSELRSKLSLYERVHIEVYSKLQTFLKHISIGYKPKKVYPFTSNDITVFLNTAPDSDYLATKVALIMAETGVCSSTEMYRMYMEDIHNDLYNSRLIVSIPNPYVYEARKFTIPPKYYDTCKKYLNGRSEGTNKYVFYLYRNNKTIKQHIGIATFNRMARDIAVYLKLENAEKYSGQSLRSSIERRIFVESNSNPALTSCKPVRESNHQDKNGHTHNSTSDDSLVCEENEVKPSPSNNETFEFVNIFKDMSSSDDEVSVKPLEQTVLDISSEEENEEEEDQVMQEEQSTILGSPVEDCGIQIEQSVSQDSRDVPPLILSDCTNCTFNITINNYFDGKNA